MPVEYVCDICCKVFNHKSHFDNHIQRLTPCKAKIFQNIQNIENTNPIIDQNMAKTNCMHCEKIFATQSNRIRHQKTCKTLNADNKMKYMEDKLKELEQIIIKQSANLITQNNTQNNNTQNNNYIQNIVINKHGHEDMSYLTDNQKIHNLSKGFNSITEYIKIMHFDPAHPENSNIFLPSLKSPDVKLYDGKMWIADDSNDAINTLLDNTKCQVEDNFKELKSKLPPKIKELYEKVINNDNEVVFKTHKKQTRYILYNKKHIPIKIKKANLCKGMAKQATASLIPIL